MVKRPDDKTPPPPGGRVAARRHMYESSRGLAGRPDKKDDRSANEKHKGDSGTAATRGSSHANRGKQKD
jgi:hypothetical protein